ncbi:MAG: LPS assembly lipoprotein LptE [Nitrospinota bacterium]|nr:LPS assembly lipoprotein LptE [Nitrospinota bacterium]
MNAHRIVWLGLLMCLTLWACGYQMAGRGASQLPPHLKTIAIPVFENSSPEPTIQRPFTEALRRAFITDGRLRLVNNKGGADLVVTGTLTKYWIRAVAFNANDVAIEYWVYLEADILVQDQVKNEVYLKQTLSTRWDYLADDSVVTSETSRQQALTQTYRVLSQRLVSLVNDKF